MQSAYSAHHSLCNLLNYCKLCASPAALCNGLQCNQCVTAMFFLSWSIPFHYALPNRRHCLIGGIAYNYLHGHLTDYIIDLIRTPNHPHYTFCLYQNHFFGKNHLDSAVQCYLKSICMCCAIHIISL